MFSQRRIKIFSSCQTKTTSGRTCQQWTAQSPHTHSIDDNDPSKGIGSHNYCRNPDGEPGGIWCYTTDANKRWEYCDPLTGWNGETMKSCNLALNIPSMASTEKGFVYLTTFEDATIASRARTIPMPMVYLIFTCLCINNNAGKLIARWFFTGFTSLTIIN